MLYPLSRRQFLRRTSMIALGTMLTAACAPVMSPAQSETTTAQEKVEVHIFDYDPTGTDAWVVADQQFTDYFSEKYPELALERTQAPWTGFTEKLLTSIAGGAKYDVIYGYWEWLPLFMENKVVGPIDELLAADSELSADDFYEYAKETIDGQTYGLAWFISGWLHWYNRSAVANASYADLKESDLAGEWDYDAWLLFAQDFTGEQDGAPIYGYDVASTRSSSVYAMLAWAWGTDLWNEDFSESLVNSPENIQLWSWLQQFYTEGLSPTPGTGTQETLGFTTGRSMATMAGQWYTRNIVQDDAASKFDIGMVQFPKGPAGQFSVAALNSYYFAREPANAGGAWNWYKERSFSETAGEIYAPIGGGRFPPRKSITPAVLYEWEDTEVYESIRPNLRTYRASPKESEWVTMWGAAWDEMSLGTRPVAEILDQLAQESVSLVS